MSKLIVSANSYEHLTTLLDKDIDGVILSIKDLSVNDNYYVTVDDIKKIDFKKKQVFVSVNKLMHNRDLDNLRIVMNNLKDMDVIIIFYDMAVYNIALELGITDKLMIGQDHLNASSLTNNFYYNLGINNSYITSDITLDELLKIKENTKMKIAFLAYGYQPIFYSRRYLISNYLDFIGKDKKNGEYEIVSDMDTVYPISEEEYGTTIYTSKPINLINYLDKLHDIDYLFLKSNMINDNEFNLMIDKYLKHDKLDDAYIGFLETKTIYLVKQVKDE